MKPNSKKAITLSATAQLSQAAEAAVSAGLVVAAAAGNNGSAAETINTPGISPHIITVGAADDEGTIDDLDDVIAGFSSRGPTIEPDEGDEFD